MKKKLLYWIFIFTFIPSIYSQNLVVNGNFSAGNSGFTSDYGFVTPPNVTGVSGKYGVVSDPNTWLTSSSTCGDHTTGSANMMVVDGSTLNSGNDRVWIQTVPVTPGKNYSFTFWVQSLNIVNLASLETQINGVSLGAAVATPSTISCGNWLRVNYTWSAGASASAQIAIYDRVVQATGNEFAIDDIELVQLPTATISGGNTVCLNSTGNVLTLTGADGIAPYTFVYNINGGSNLSVTSSTGDSATVQVPTDVTGTFNYNLVSVSYGTAPSYSQNQGGVATINVLALPTATITGDAFVCSGATGTVNFNGTPGATVTYTINGGPNQIVTLSAAGTGSATSLPLTASSTYELVSIDSNGTTNCSQSLTGSATLSVPTATIFGNTTINPGESAVITFYGTPGVTVNFTSVLGPQSVAINAAGVGTYNIPYLDTTTVFSLVNATVGACITPLIGNVTITVRTVCDIANTGDLPLAEVDIVAPQAVCNVGQCTDLLAEYTRIATTDDGVAATDDYAVCSIPYAPTFPFTGGTVVNATGDDAWSSIATLPFTFNFYGNCYNNVLVGTNGVITFDIGVAPPLQVPLGYCNWPYTATIPNGGFPIKNAVFGVYQDTNIASPPVVDPTIQNVNYYVLDSGPNAAPNRVFVANFNELPQFSCNDGVGRQTSQIVLHETTNIIEVLVSKRTSCVGWNSGSGLIGILNQTGTLAEVPPGRNTGTWGAVNEAWRFSPIAEPSPLLTELTWELNGNPIGSLNENPLNICPTVSGTYSAVVSYKKCDGTTDEVRKDITVGPAPPLPATDPINITVCSSSLPPYTINIDQNALILSTIPLADQANYSIKYYENLNDAKNDAPTNIDISGTAALATYQVSVVPRTIYVRIEDLVTTGCYNIRSFVIDVVTSPSGTFSYPGNPYCNNDVVPKNPTLFALTSGGTFTALPAGLTINPNTGAIDGSTSAAGVYTVTYDIPATALCPAFSTTATVEIIPCSCTVTSSSASQTICLGTAITPITYTSSTGATAASVPIADLPSGVTGIFSGGTFTISGTPTAAGTYTFTVTCETGITDTCSATTTIQVNAQPNAGVDGSTVVCDSSVTPVDLNLLITSEQTGGTWTRLTGTGGTFNSGSGTFLPAVGASNINTFEYRIAGVAPCVDDFSVATVTINSQPNAGSDGSVLVCDSSVTLIDLNTLITGQQAGGTWTRTGTGTGGVFTAAAGTFMPTGATTSTFEYTLVGTTPCINDVSVATVNINAQPNAGTDGTPQVVCDSNTAVINLNTLITGEQSGGVWTRTGTGGTFDPIAGTFAPALGATTSTFTYTITGTLPCVNDFSEVIININAQPDAGASGSTLVCDSSTTLIDLNTLISGQQAGGTWTRTGTGTGGVFTAAAGTFMPTGATTSTFEYTLVGTTPCINDVSIATVNINAQPYAGTDGATQIVCDSSTTMINLFNLITGEQSGGVWTRTGTGGTFDPIAGTFTPSPGATTSTFTYTITGTLPCVDDFSEVIVTINAQPDAGTSGSALVCDSSTTLIDLNTIITGQQSGGTWTQLTGSGGSFDPILGTFTPASGAITSTFQYELVGVAPCVNSTSIATVNINPQPNAGTSGGVTICETDTTLIDLNIIISGQQPGGTWTRTGGTGGTFNSATGSFTSAIGATTSTFEYRLPGVAPCVDSTSVATVTINRQPNAGVADPPLLVCDNSNTPINLFNLITGEQSGGIWTRVIGTGGVFDGVAGTFTPTPGAISSVFSYDILATAPCVNVSSQVSIVVIAAPNAGVDGVITICDSSTTAIVLNTLITGEQPGGVWTRTGTGTGGNFDPIAGTFTPASGATTSTFTYTVNGVAPCGNDTSVATININAQPNAGVAGLPKEVCDNDTAFIDLFSLINGEQTGGTWVRSSGTGGVFDSTTARYTPAPGATSSTFTYTITGVAPCVNSSSLATININAQPNAGVDGVVAVCDSSTTAIDLFSLISAEQPGGVWTRTGGTGGVFDATLGTFTPGVGATSSTFAYTLIGTLPCSNDSSIATVNISPQPNAGVDGVTSICDSSATAIDLFGLITSEQAGGTWSRTSGTGGLFNAASGSFTPSAGSTTSSFTYTIPGVAPCVNDSSVALVNINNQPNAGIDGAPQIVCESATTTVDLYSLIIGEQPGGTWTRSSGTGGIFNAIAGTFVPGVGATSSTFTYTLLGTAPCVNDSSLASVTILPTASIALTSGVSTQTLCINNNITPFSYTIGNGALGASITSGDLPLGVNPIFTAGVLTISGTALESGTFPFVVTTTGGCSFSSLSGVLVVSPDVRLIPTSPTSTTFQSACINELIDPITYRTENNPTSVSVTGLPPGITGVYAGGVLTISGSSSVVATYPYVVTTVGGCGVDSLNGTITINPDVTIALVSPASTASQTVCINDPILPITYQLGNGATGASLVAGTVPEGIQGSYNSITKTFTINGVTRESGTFTYIIRTLGGCGTASLTGTINVNPLPVISLPQDGYICVDPSGNPISDYTLTTNLSTSQYSFEWSDINGVIVGETGNSYLATVPGPYSVKVTNLTTNCYDTQNATITPSLAPSSATTSQTTYFADNQEVVVSVQPPGEYLYQLDSGPFQTNNYFLALFSGEHTVTVKDKFGCGTAQATFRIVNFPKFFTPNEDGYNDTWNIFEIADQPEAYISIFDRYGKLIKQISTQGEGWDGKYNGTALPGDDYWFKVFYKENGQDKEFRSHFALKR